MIENLKFFACNQASSYGLGNQTTTVGSVSTFPLISLIIEDTGGEVNVDKKKLCS